MVRSAPPRVFNLYDIVGVLVPGITLLTGLLLLFPEPPAPSELWEYLLYGIVAFSLGYIVQFWASRAVGESKTFKNTLDEVRRPLVVPSDSTTTRDADPQPDGQHTERTGNSWSRVRAGVGHLLYAFAGPVLWWFWSPTDRSVGYLHTNRVWRHIRDTYNLDPGTDEYEELQQMIQSEVDDVRSPSRAYRFQAIRNFHRGMWVSLWAISVLLLGYCINERFIGIEVGLIHATGGGAPYVLLQDWWFLGVLLLLCSIPTFWWLHVEYRRDFIRYLIIDYFVKLREKGEGEASEREEGDEGREAGLNYLPRYGM